jgi:hypothetical protein
VAGFNVTLETVGGLTVRLVFCEAPFAVAVIVTVEAAPTAEVVTVKVAVVAPAATTTDAGTDAAPGVPDVSVTVVPLGLGATEPIVTVPEEVVPPVTAVGLTTTPVTTGAVMARLAVLLDEPVDAVIVDDALALTGVVLMVNVPVVAVPEIVTDVTESVAAALLDARLTVTDPPVGEPLSVTVPIDDAPPATDVGLRVTEEGVGTMTLRVTELVLAPTVAVIVTVVFADWNVLFTGNENVVCPAGIFTEEATVATDVFEEDRSTTSPPVGAAFASVTVPLAVWPPNMVVPVNVSVTVLAAVRPSVPVVEDPLAEAVIVAVCSVETTLVVTVNVIEVEPAGTVTVPPVGTMAAVSLEESVTTTPPVGAACVRVTVPTEDAPPTTLAGLNETEATPTPVTARVPVWLEPFAVAVIVADVLAPTGTVVTVKVPVVAPAATVAGLVTEATAVFDEDRATE